MRQRIAPGQRFGPYEFVEEIGRGGSAVVFRAHHPELGRDVAVKVIATGFAGDSTFQARFRQEASLVSRLDHPHILPIVDSGESGFDGHFGEVAFLVTEYMPGGNLADALQAERAMRQRCELALAVAEQIGAALDHAHAAGVLHRDLKPSNVLIDADGALVLGDFGLARALQSSADSLHLTATGLVAGTPAYMAPEQALGERADARTDLYGLAVVLYQIVTGRVPFEAETPLATMLAHVHQPPPSPRELAPETPLAVETVLLHALSKTRDERYASGQELALAFRAAVRAAFGATAVAQGASTVTRARVVSGHPKNTRGAGQSRRSSALTAQAARRPRRRISQAVRLLLAAIGMLSTVSAASVGMVAYALGPGRAPLAEFAERFALSSTDPTWTDAWPGQGARNQSLQTSISIRFSHDMDRESVEASVVMEPPVAVSYTWDQRTLTLAPLEELKEGTEYILFLDHSRALDASGRPLSRPLIRRFTTLALPVQVQAPPPAVPAGTGAGPSSLVPPFLPQPTPERVPPLTDLRGAATPEPATRVNGGRAPAPSQPPLILPTYAPPAAPAQPPDTSMVAGLVVSADDDEMEAAANASPAPMTTPVPTAVVAAPTAAYPNGVALVNAPPASPSKSSAAVETVGATSTIGSSDPSSGQATHTESAPTSTPSRVVAPTPTTRVVVIPVTQPASSTPTASPVATTPNPGPAASPSATMEAAVAVPVSGSATATVATPSVVASATSTVAAAKTSTPSVAGVAGSATVVSPLQSPTAAI
jgi:serine/threonine protein kinase